MRAPLVLAALAGSTTASIVSSYLPGYGFNWTPYSRCGWACRNVVNGATLTCTPEDHGGHSHAADDELKICKANDTALLTSIAYCMDQRCDKEPIPEPWWLRERFWGSYMVDDTGKIIPKWTLQQAIEQGSINGTPTLMYNSSSEDILNQTVVIGDEDYKIQLDFNDLFYRVESLQARYIFVLLAIGFGTPIFFTLLGYMPFMTGIMDKLKPYIVYPSLIGTYHVRPLPWLLGNAPTVGQALWIFLFFALNIILTAVNYETSPEGEMPWGWTSREEILAYIGYRTGHIGYALLPLTILFSGRNNFLLWMTNWSYDTYLLLHRWIARAFALHAIVHSIVLLICYESAGSYPTEFPQPYWSWGIVATVMTVAMLIFSMLWFRNKMYELFLIGHIIMAIFVIAGCWYHIVYRWGNNFYLNWLYAACAVWFFDRLVRVIRIGKNGMKRATVTELGNEHVRVDIPDIRWVSRPGYVAYAYFPTLSPMRPWENHPFSINSTTLFNSYKHTTVPAAQSLHGSSSSDGGQDIEKPSLGVQVKPASAAGTEPGSTAGLTLIVKKSAGLTRLLKSDSRMLTLIDGPYPQKPSSSVLKTDFLVLIGGGVGITGLISWISAHPNIKLAWSVRSQASALVEAMDTVLASVADKEVHTGERCDIDRILRSAADAGYKKVGVVVCGPSGMCDDVRAKVAGLGRSSKTVFELEVDAFTW